MLSELLRDNDQDLQLRCLLAQARLWSGRHAEALALLRELADEMDPDSFHLQVEYAAALLSNDQPREALVWLRRQPNLTPDGQYLLAAIYSRLGEFQSAADIYRQIIQEHPQDRRAHHMLADMSAWGRDYDTAIRLYRQLLREQPDDEALQVGLANAYLWNHQHQQALNLYVGILERAPGRTDLWSSVLYAAWPRDVELSPRAERVLASIARSRAEWPDEADFRLGMSEVMFRMDREAVAVGLLREVVANQPANLDARRRLADELHRLGQYSFAEWHYQALIEHDRNTTKSTLPSLTRGSSAHFQRMQRPSRGTITQRVSPEPSG